MLSDPQIFRWMSRFDNDFITLAHPHQEPPLRANGGDHWTTWLMLGGRGAGKTRLGAEWVRAMAHGIGPYAERRSLQIALVGETEHDVREVMIEAPRVSCGSLRAANVRRGRRRAGGWNGRMARLVSRFPRKIPNSCAGRSSMPHGATNSRNGATWTPPSTCCNSACASDNVRAS